MAETTVFQSGNSQAVRLPKEFRFKSKTVEIYRRGDEVILREKKRTLGEALEAAWAHLPPLTDDDVRDIERTFAIVKDRRPPQERDWSSLFGTDKPSRPAKSASKRGRSK